MGVPVRAVLREKGTPYAELGLADESLSDDAPHRLDDRASNPHQSPDRGDSQGREALSSVEAVLDLLPPQQGEFRKEDGEVVVDAHGRAVA
jgi:arsenate reductase